MAHSAYSHARGGGKWSAPGEAQYVSTELVANTATATATAATTRDYGTEVHIPSNRVVALRALIAARKTDGTLGKAWTVVGAARCDAAGAVTVLGTPTVTVLGGDAGASAWAVAVSSGTNKLRLMLTGAAATQIHWSVTAETKEVG